MNVGPFQIVAVNPPARKVGSSKGSKMAKGKSVVNYAARRGRKFLGLSMPIVETGVASAAGILGTNYVSGLVIEKVNQSWMQTWYGKVAVKVGVAVGINIAMRKLGLGRFATPILAGGLSSAALSVVKNFAPNSYDTRWGLAGDDSPEEIGAQQALNGLVDTADLLSDDNRLSGLIDADTPFARMN